MQLLVHTIILVCSTNSNFPRFQVDDVESLKSSNVSPQKVGNDFFCISYEMQLWSVASI